jgi:hypothetical protein
MATDAPPPQPESGHVHAAIPQAVTALSAARTDHTKPLSDCSGLTGSGYSREEPSARKTLGSVRAVSGNGRYEFLKAA